MMDKGIRVTNYIVDTVVILIIWVGMTSLVPLLFFEGLGFYLFMFLYYFIFEFITGQTLGKKITRTIVVKKDGQKPTFLFIFMRTFLRLIPLDSFSYAFGTERGFHDVLSSTRLIKKERISNIE